MENIFKASILILVWLLNISLIISIKGRIKQRIIEDRVNRKIQEQIEYMDTSYLNKRKGDEKDDTKRDDK